jgi:HSP20 family molecular chaperone IbpA
VQPYFRLALVLQRVSSHIADAVAITGPRQSSLSSAKDVKMTKLTLASYPHLLGFEQLERLLERTAKSGNDGYPPFNIEQTSDMSYRITLAVAGFAESDGRVFLHRGIAARQFQRTFVLADGVEVGEAIIENGLLHVDLKRSAPETVVQTIQIKRG